MLLVKITLNILTIINYVLKIFNALLSFFDVSQGNVRSF